jgi:large subunit ribosomal protein L7e
LGVKLINLIYRYINKQQISNLIHKRGRNYNSEGNVQELENELIENSLGQYGILCLEDIIYEIGQCGKYFNEVNKFLGFFSLAPNESIKEKIHIKFSRQGSQGFRGDKINDLVKEMI